MKKRFKYRKTFQQLAIKMGLPDVVDNPVVSNPTRETGFRMLINNHRRFVKGLLKLSLEEQRQRIDILNLKIKEAEANK